MHYERHRPEQTTLYRIVQQHAASFIAHTEASTGSELPGFIKDEFDGVCPSPGCLKFLCAEKTVLRQSLAAARADGHLHDGEAIVVEAARHNWQLLDAAESSLPAARRRAL